MDKIQIEQMFQGVDQVGLIYLRVKDYFMLLNAYGESFVAELNKKNYSFLQRTSQERLENFQGQIQDVIFLEKGEFLLIISGISNNLKTNGFCIDNALLLKIKLENFLKEKYVPKIGQKISLEISSTVLKFNSVRDRARELFLALDKLRQHASSKIKVYSLRLTNEFYYILKHEKIQIVYQPIIDLSNGSILGWEALSRGPKDSLFASPLALFDFAEEIGELFALERLCRELSIKNLGEIHEGQLLFLNIHPKTISDPDFTPGATKRILRTCHLSPLNVVFEITEKHSLKDFSWFYKTLEHYRKQGFKIAIDDAGAGYSGLWTIAELQPDFIKIDRELVQGIEHNPIKRALMETMVVFANKVGSKIIAEGIETETTLTALIDIGVHYGQGYFLARPAYPKPERVIACFPYYSSKMPQGFRLMPIGELIERPYIVRENELVKDVHEMLEKQPSIASLVICNEQDEPVGFIMAHRLNKRLASQYGISLYYKRPIKVLAEDNFLCVESDTPIESLAQQVSTRDRERVYDDIVVVEKKKVKGVVSVQKLMDYLAKIQIEIAKGCNPLTGLPGNVAIEKEIEIRLKSNTPFSVVYADLDNFKVYNDVYGFKQGDEIIKLIATIIRWSLKRHGNKNDFLGHVGGDDFVFITSPDKVERVCLAITRCFGRLVKNCYTCEHRKAGKIKAKGRDGQERWFDFVSVSLAIVDCYNKDKTANLYKIVERATELKKVVKKMPGNVYFRDRRTPL